MPIILPKHELRPFVCTRTHMMCGLTCACVNNFETGCTCKLVTHTCLQVVFGVHVCRYKFKCGCVHASPSTHVQVHTLTCACVNNFETGCTCKLVTHTCLQVVFGVHVCRYKFKCECVHASPSTHVQVHTRESVF